MREIKFRVFDKKYNHFSEEPFFRLLIAKNGQIYNTEEDHWYKPEERYVIQFYTGLKDKHGKEIYEGELLRIRGKMGNNKEYSYDAIYRVNLSTFRGINLSFVKLTNKEPDSTENSYPINTSLSFSDGIDVDYVNNKYDHLAICNHYYSDSFGKRHQDNHYSNDIEKIGNIYENPELLKT